MRRRKGDVVWATHPNNKNFDERARGRVLHIFKNKKLTFCNMFPTEKVTNGITLKYREICRSCLNEFNKG